MLIQHRPLRLWLTIGRRIRFVVRVRMCHMIGQTSPSYRDILRYSGDFIHPGVEYWNKE